MKNLATLVTLLAAGITSGYGTEAYSKPQKMYVIIPDICLPETVELGMLDESGNGYNGPHPSIKCQDDQQRAVVCTTSCHVMREQDHKCTYIAEICYIAKLPQQKEPPKTEDLPL